MIWSNVKKRGISTWQPNALFYDGFFILFECEFGFLTVSWLLLTFLVEYIKKPTPDNTYRLVISSFYIHVIIRRTGIT